MIHLVDWALWHIMNNSFNPHVSYWTVSGHFLHVIPTWACCVLHLLWMTPCTRADRKQEILCICTKHFIVCLLLQLISQTCAVFYYTYYRVTNLCANSGNWHDLIQDAGTNGVCNNIANCINMKKRYNLGEVTSMIFQLDPRPTYTVSAFHHSLYCFVPVNVWKKGPISRN